MVRSLGAAGIPLFVFGAQGTFVTSSRHYRTHPMLSRGDLEENRLAEFLGSLGNERAVLIPCSDDWLRAVAGLRPDLSERFVSSLPPRSVVEDVADKERFRGLLTALDLPRPRTRLLERIEDFEGLEDEAFPQAILKPCNSQAFARAYNAKAFRPRTRAEAEACWNRARGDGHALLFQEYIPGPATEHYFIDGFVDRRGRPCAVFARRRIRMEPLALGNSTHTVSIPVTQIQPAADDILRLLREVSYRGIFSVEFKRDPRDGLYKFLEINGRPWWYIGFATHCGLDMARMAYDDALGRDVAPVTSYEIGAKCTYLHFDLRAARRMIRAGELGAASWLASIRGSYWPVFSWKDVGPAVADTWSSVLKILRLRHDS